MRLHGADRRLGWTSPRGRHGLARRAQRSRDMLTSARSAPSRRSPAAPRRPRAARRAAHRARADVLGLEPLVARVAGEPVGDGGDQPSAGRRDSGLVDIGLSSTSSPHLLAREPCSRPGSARPPARAGPSPAERRRDEDEQLVDEVGARGTRSRASARPRAAATARPRPRARASSSSSGPRRSSSSSPPAAGRARTRAAAAAAALDVARVERAARRRARCPCRPRPRRTPRAARARAAALSSPEIQRRPGTATRPSSVTATL